MSDPAASVEAAALQRLQAWMKADAGAMRKLLHRDCTIMVGTAPPHFLDRPSFIAALEKDFQCLGFKLDQPLIRPHGSAVWWVSGAQLDLRVGKQDWRGQFLITDLWHKGVLGGWKLAESSLAPCHGEQAGAMAQWIRGLQRWH